MNYETYYSIMEIMGVKLFDEFGNQNNLDDSQQKILKKAMEDYAERFPKSNAHLRIAMKFLTGQDFA